MKKLLPLVVACGLLLSACRSDTVFVVSVSVLNLIPEELRTLPFPVATGIGLSFDMPGQQGLEDEDFTFLPKRIVSNLQRFEVRLDGVFSLGGTGLDFIGDVPRAEIDLELFLSDSGSPFVTPTDVIKQAVTFAHGESQYESLVFEIDEQTHPELLALVQTGDFKLGLRVTLVKVGEELDGLGIATMKLDDLFIAAATKATGFIQ